MLFTGTTTTSPLSVSERITTWKTLTGAQTCQTDAIHEMLTFWHGAGPLTDTRWRNSRTSFQGDTEELSFCLWVSMMTGFSFQSSWECDSSEALCLSLSWGLNKLASQQVDSPSVTSDCFNAEMLDVLYEIISPSNTCFKSDQNEPILVLTLGISVN